MEEKLFIEGKYGKICGILNDAGNKDEIVIIVHGFTSSKKTSAEVNARYLANLNISSLRIDLDNFGESDLEFPNVSVSKYVKQVEACAKEMIKQDFKNISLVGTSFGGVVAIGYAMNNPIKRMFLRCPGAGSYFRFLAEGKGAEYDKLREVGYEVRSKGDMEYKLSLEYVDDLRNYYPLEEKVAKFDFPIEIIHGNADKVIPYESSKSISKHIKKGKLITIEGADHGLGVNNDYSIGLEALVDFFRH